MGEGDKQVKPDLPELGRTTFPPLAGSSFVDPYADLVGSNGVAGLFWSPPSPYQTIAPQIPPPPPVCFPMGLVLDIPSIGHDGAVDGMMKRRIEFDEPIRSSTAIVLYAVPRSVVETLHDPARGVCEPVADAATSCEPEEPVSQPWPFGFPPFRATIAPTFGPIDPSVAPPHLQAPPVPELEALSLSGDFIITRTYTAYAVGSGSLRVVRSEHGVISLIDAGVGPHAHTELSAAILAELNSDIGNAPIAEILLSHVHEDHASLLPDIARERPIGKIRINAYQHQDPRMLTILKNVAEASADRIRREIAAEAEPRRAAWEAAPERGQVQVDAFTREARWHGYLETLAQEQLEKSAIILETAFVGPDGEVHVTASPILGDLILPRTPGAPVLLERGFLEASSPMGPRITTARPSIAFDLDKLISKQLEARAGDPEATVRAAENITDANEATFVIDLGTSARLFVTPDKRAPDIASIQDVLEADVARLNAELQRLGRKPAKLQIWDMSHHARSGFVAGVSEIRTLIESLHTLTRVQHASGGVTTDIVLVSGHVDPADPAKTLVDPLTVWTLNELGIEVFVATDRAIDVLEVLLSDGSTLVGLTAEPYKTGIPSEGTLRRVEAALRKLSFDIDALERTKPTRKGTKAAVYSAHSDAIKSLEGLARSIRDARTAYLEYYEGKLRPDKRGAAAPGIAPDDAEAAAKRAAIDALLADERVKPAVEEAAAKAHVFDPVALTLLKRPANVTPELQSIVDAILRADAARLQLESSDSVDARAELAKQLTLLRPLLATHAGRAQEGTKQLIEDVLAGVDKELAQVTKPTQAAGDATSQTTPDGAFTIDQRIRFEKPPPTGADRLRHWADKTTRPLGAIMIYSLVKKQIGLQQGANDGTVDLPEHILGTAHTAYGVTLGVRMLKKIDVSNTEFAILGVIDIFETATRHYATGKQRATAIAYSVIRNGVNVGLSILGTRMMQSKSKALVVLGFAIQFLGDPFLEWTGIASLFDSDDEEFLPDDVVAVRKRIQTLMSEYTVLIGLLELSKRTALRTRDGGDPTKRIQSDIDNYRSKVLETEAALLSSFDMGYYVAKTAFAGLPVLDTMREQFLEMQHREHEGDTEHSAQSRTQTLDAFEAIERNVSLDYHTVDEIRAMKQWTELDKKLDELERRIGGSVDWKAAAKTESELDQMLANARYRLDPSPLGLRISPLLTPGTAGHGVYEAALIEREARAATIHERLFLAEPVEPTGDPFEDAITRAERAVVAYKTAREAVPAFVGLSARQLAENSFDLAKAYPAYVGSHSGYRDALYKLESAELMLKTTVSRLDALSLPTVSGPVFSTSPEMARVDNIHHEMATEMSARITCGFLFLDEAKQRSIDVREEENTDIATRLGETGVQPITTPERMAILTRGLPVSTSSTIIDRLNAMPMLARVQANGYMEGVYRYVDQFMPASRNALIGDLRRSQDVPDPHGDGEVEVHLYVPLNEAAQELWPNHFFMTVNPIIGTSPYADLPRPLLALYDEERDKDHLQKIKLEELKP